jgi:hypothetical protein
MVHRTAIALAAAAAIGGPVAATTTARAQDASSCAPEAPVARDCGIGPYLTAADEAAAAALGAQFATTWLEGDGWVAGLAPGPLDAAAARAAIARELASRVPADGAAALLAALRISPQAYGRDELQGAIDALTPPLGPLLTAAAVAPEDGVVRARIGVWDDAEPGVVPARAAQLAAPYGDRVVLTATDPRIMESGGVPEGALAKGDERLGRYVSIAACTTGGRLRVTVRAARRAEVGRLLIAADRRHRAAGPKLAVSFTARARAGSRVRVEVVLRDGATVGRTVTARAC